MYAIGHAATALLLKKKNEKAPILPFLVSVQLVEILWVVFTYLGIEHSMVVNGKFHLDYLPFSHSVFSGLVLSVLSYIAAMVIWKDNKIAILIAIGVISHIVLDVIFHEPDIQLSPFSRSPIVGLGVIDYPLLDFLLEMMYGLFCWWYFGGGKKLLAVIVIFNLLNLPTMFASTDTVNALAKYPALIPSIIFFQIIATWYFVNRYSKLSA